MDLSIYNLLSRVHGVLSTMLPRFLLAVSQPKFSIQFVRRQLDWTVWQIQLTLDKAKKRVSRNEEMEKVNFEGGFEIFWNEVVMMIGCILHKVSER